MVGIEYRKENNDQKNNDQNISYHGSGTGWIPGECSTGIQVVMDKEGSLLIKKLRELGDNQ